jgi:hypothetical protein
MTKATYWNLFRISDSGSRLQNSKIPTNPLAPIPVLPGLCDLCGLSRLVLQLSLGFRICAARLVYLAVLLSLFASPWTQAHAASIPIIVSPQAPLIERLAAQDLARILHQLYPGDQFVLAEALPAAGQCILVGSVAQDAEVWKRVAANKLAVSESYVVSVAHEGGRQLGIIAGADPRGTAYAVYGLLEKLGCGFYLSGDTLPAPRREEFSFAAWELASRPLVGDRLVFDWHNFLSGCSTWNLDDWLQWLRQSQKMGYNAVMVHAYGNTWNAGFVTRRSSRAKRAIGLSIAH